MKAVVEFLRQLHAHNERAWFEAHRAEWLQLQERVRSFAEGLIEGIASFDPSVEGLTAKDCTYRIYRDGKWDGKELTDVSVVGDDLRVVVNHQRAVGRHKFHNPWKLALGERDAERANLRVDVLADLVAEFHGYG